MEKLKCFIQTFTEFFWKLTILDRNCLFVLGFEITNHIMTYINGATNIDIHTSAMMLNFQQRKITYSIP